MEEYLYWMMIHPDRVPQHNAAVRDFAPHLNELTGWFREAMLLAYPDNDSFIASTKFIWDTEQGCRRLATYHQVPGWTRIHLCGCDLYWPGVRSGLASVCDPDEYHLLLQEVPSFHADVMERPDWLALVEAEYIQRPYIQCTLDGNNILALNSLGPLSDPRFIPESMIRTLFEGTH